MPDEPAPVEVQDKPTDETTPIEGQVETPATPDAPDDIQRSYQELRKEFTQRTQEWSEERKQAEYATALVNAAQNPEHPQHREAVAALGFDLAEADEPEYQDETEALKAEVEQMKQFLSQQGEEAEFAAMQAQEDDYLMNEVMGLQTKEGRDFDQGELELLLSTALSNRTEQGVPNVAHAYEVLTGVYDARMKGWQSTKQAPRAPGGGPAAQKQFDINDPKAKMEAAIAAAEGAGAD